MDAGKKISGIKRHIAMDAQGLPHAIAVSYVGEPFAQGVRDILGETVTVQIAKHSELHTFKLCPNAGSSSAALLGWRRTDDYGKTANVYSIQGLQFIHLSFLTLLLRRS